VSDVIPTAVSILLLRKWVFATKKNCHHNAPTIEWTLRWSVSMRKQRSCGHSESSRPVD
jgi:hypothetical protein